MSRGNTKLDKMDLRNDRGRYGEGADELYSRHLIGRWINNYDEWRDYAFWLEVGRRVHDDPRGPVVQVGVVEF